MTFEESIVINAPAKAVFGCYERVDQWSSWDPDLKSSSLKGAFVSGAVGEVVPKGGPKSTLHFSDVLANRGFAATCKLPLCSMRFEHELSAVDGGTKATHRVVFSGFLAPLFGRLIGSGMKKTLPHALAGLKRVSESA
jgi:hypothetical protein